MIIKGESFANDSRENIEPMTKINNCVNIGSHLPDHVDFNPLVSPSKNLESCLNLIIQNRPRNKDTNNPKVSLLSIELF